LSEKQSEKEDSDEDQFEEDEESQTSSPKKESKSLSEDKKPAKTMTHAIHINENKKAEKKPKEIVDDNIDDEDESEDEDDSVEKTQQKKPAVGDKEKITVAIEPIVKIHREELLGADEFMPAYARHDMLVADAEEDHQQTSSSSTFVSNLTGGSSHTNFAIGLMASAMILMAIALLIKRRARHPGFIEVDVISPEERHVNGLQVNGYENPTYTFFDTKP